MRSLTYEELLSLKKKEAKLASIVFKDPNIEKIIHLCRLKPLNIRVNSKIEIHSVWVDGFGNSLNLSKRDKKIIQYDLSIKHDDSLDSDLYSKLTILNTSKISRLTYFLIGKEEDLKSDHAILAFVGIDGVLRCFSFIYNEWIRVPPLLLGYKTLRLISKNMLIKNIKVFNSSCDILFPCSKQISYMTKWPPPENFKKKLSEIIFLKEILF